MKVLFDHQAFTMQRYGGVSRCFLELYRHFPEDVKVDIGLDETVNAYLKELSIGHPYGYFQENFICSRHFPFKELLFKVYKRVCGFRFYGDKYAYNRYVSIQKLKKGDFDVFHPTFFDDYFLPYLNGKPFVLTIHDMIPELYPQYFDAEKDMQILGKRKLAPLASAIIAVSETTKKDVVRILGVPKEKVHVVYHGSEHIKSCATKAKSGKPYILYVGARTIYKDFKLFAEKITEVLKRHSELRVICTGVPFSDEEKEQFTRLGVRERFVHKWVKSDEEFASLYHNAKVFVYTSEYEGFGIPILEAYSADCPVLLNNTSCFPEIAGDAAVYFTFDNLAEQLDYVLTLSTEERERLVLRQRERLEMYSWEKSAEKLRGIYESVCRL